MRLRREKHSSILWMQQLTCERKKKTVSERTFFTYIFFFCCYLLKSDTIVEPIKTTLLTISSNNNTTRFKKKQKKKKTVRPSKKSSKSILSPLVEKAATGEITENLLLNSLSDWIICSSLGFFDGPTNQRMIKKYLLKYQPFDTYQNIQIIIFILNERRRKYRSHGQKKKSYVLNPLCKDFSQERKKIICGMVEGKEWDVISHHYRIDKPSLRFDIYWLLFLFHLLDEKRWPNKSPKFIRIVDLMKEKNINNNNKQFNRWIGGKKHSSFGIFKHYICL